MCDLGIERLVGWYYSLRQWGIPEKGTLVFPGNGIADFLGEFTVRETYVQDMVGGIESHFQTVVQILHSS